MFVKNVLEFLYGGFAEFLNYRRSPIFKLAILVILFAVNIRAILVMVVQPTPINIALIILVVLNLLLIFIYDNRWLKNNPVAGVKVKGNHVSVESESVAGFRSAVLDHDLFNLALGVQCINTNEIYGDEGYDQTKLKFHRDKLELVLSDNDSAKALLDDYTRLSDYVDNLMAETSDDVVASLSSSFNTHEGVMTIHLTAIGKMVFIRDIKINNK